MTGIPHFNFHAFDKVRTIGGPATNGPNHSQRYSATLGRSGMAKTTTPEFGTPHMAAVAFHAFALPQWGVTHPEFDDRYTP